MFAFHACWWDRDCRAAPCPAHTYVTVFGFVWRINPFFSRYYLRQRDGRLYVGLGVTYEILQYIGTSLPERGKE